MKSGTTDGCRRRTARRRATIRGVGHVVISYSREDSEFADQIVAALEAAGVEVWIDRQNLRRGEWERKITQAIKAADDFVLIVSPRSEASDRVQDEWHFAREVRDADHLHPVILEPTEWFGLHRYHRHAVVDGEVPRSLLEVLGNETSAATSTMTPAAGVEPSEPAEISVQSLDAPPGSELVVLLKSDLDEWNHQRRDRLIPNHPDLREANLHWADLAGANLAGANLQWANLAGASLRGANLAYAYLAEANLHEANLFEAMLFEAMLFQADLRVANLRGADLRRADLRVADLRGADLSGADLHGADLGVVSWDTDTVWPEGIEPPSSQS